MIPGSKGHDFHACMKVMTLGPAKHEKVAARFDTECINLCIAKRVTGHGVNSNY